MINTSRILSRNTLEKEKKTYSFILRPIIPEEDALLRWGSSGDAAMKVEKIK